MMDLLLIVLYAIVALFAALYLFCVMVNRPQRWRHKARGSTYAVVDAQGVVQTDAPLRDYDMVVIYRDEKTGRHYVRPPGEFMDGRFEKI